MITVRVFNDYPRKRIRRPDTIRLAGQVLRREWGRRADVSIVFIDDQRMIELNSQYLHHNVTTDVLSFPLSDEANTLEGEVYVNLDQAQRQAREYGVTVHNEVARLVIHGLLHLVGYRDATKREKIRMTEMEEMFLSRLYTVVGT